VHPSAKIHQPSCRLFTIRYPHGFTTWTDFISLMVHFTATSKMIASRCRSSTARAANVAQPMLCCWVGSLGTCTCLPLRVSLEPWRKLRMGGTTYCIFCLPGLISSSADEDIIGTRKFFKRPVAAMPPAPLTPNDLPNMAEFGRLRFLQLNHTKPLSKQLLPTFATNLC